MEGKPTINAYDAIANWYDTSIRAGLPIHALSLPSFLARIGIVQGQSVCDLACGQGIVTRELAKGGAEVVGIDLSERLLGMARAREQEEKLGIRYLSGDAQTLPDISVASFDGVTCHLALMDIPDLPATFQTVFRIVRPGGWFAFAITHPCTQTPDSRWTGKAGGTVRREIRGYFREGFWTSDNAHGVRGQVGANHRTLSTYLNTLLGAGFILQQIAEPQPENEVANRVPGHSEAPVVLQVFSRRP